MYRTTVHGYRSTQALSADLKNATAGLEPLRATFAELNAKLDAAIAASNRTLEGLGLKLDTLS